MRRQGMVTLLWSPRKVKQWSMFVVFLCLAAAFVGGAVGGYVSNLLTAGAWLDRMVNLTSKAISGGDDIETPMTEGSPLVPEDDNGFVVAFLPQGGTVWQVAEKLAEQEFVIDWSALEKKYPDDLARRLQKDDPVIIPTKTWEQRVAEFESGY